MMAISRKDIGERLKQERMRLGYNQLNFAAISESTKGTQLAWEQGKQVPNAEALALLAEAGVDIQYVLTGKASEATISEDALIIGRYRQLSEFNKGRVLGMIETLLEAE